MFGTAIVISCNLYSNNNYQEGFAVIELNRKYCAVLFDIKHMTKHFFS